MTTDPIATVSSATSGDVTTITFGGTKGNSLPAAVLRDLAEAIGAAQGSDARVLVLQSPGDGPFCAGASFDELTAIADPAAGREFFMGFARVILAMIRSPLPIVTRVQGKVVGGGVGIVAASDYAIATESSSIRLSELAVGIGPFVVGPAIERKIGVGPFAAMAIDADWRDAAWGATHGLFARVVPRDALDATVGQFAAQLARANPEAVRGIKAIAWHGTEDWPELLAERAAKSGELVLSEFTRAAIATFRAR